ncbi:MAG: hypothetical protein GF364_19130 [Candidatus Lokiarchaeota archaeon]|nr:hypothetical protein [Candidatus Lokiarchaeota archaeon]
MERLKLRRRNFKISISFLYVKRELSIMICSMEMYKKILIGVDGSEESIRAAQKAALLQKDCGSKLIIFHSVKHRMPPPRIPLLFPFNLGQDERGYAIPEADYVEIQKQYERSGKEVLKKVLKELKEFDVDVEAKLVLDIDPEDYAIKMAEEEGVDLVIVGTKGHHSKLKDLIMGSVAREILNKVPCDVLIVR